MKLLSALRMELKGGTESSPLIASIVETRNTMDKISASLEGLRESVEATKFLETPDCQAAQRSAVLHACKTADEKPLFSLR